MTHNSPPRSEIYKNLFIDEEMMDAFGTLTPTVKARTAYFFDKWMMWRNNRIRFTQSIVGSAEKEMLRQKLLQIGLRDLWDYQLRGNEIRFRDHESMAFFRLAVGDMIKEVQ